MEPHDPGRYDTVPTELEAKDASGYAVFAKDLPSPLSGLYPLESCGTVTIHSIGCRTIPDFFRSFRS